MAKRRKSYFEKQEQVYKFWLGFFEKLTVLVFAAAIIPRVVGSLAFPSTLLLAWAVIIIALISVMMYLSRRPGIFPKTIMKRRPNHDERNSLHSHVNHSLVCRLLFNLVDREARSRAKKADEAKLI